MSIVLHEIIQEFPADIKRELANPEYARLTHGLPGTYISGCRGPLCRMANRERCFMVQQKKRLEAGLAPTGREMGHPSRERDNELKLFLDIYLNIRAEMKTAI